MHYIWLNPVVLQLYNPLQLHTFIQMRGFEPVHCEQDHAEIVLQKYRRAVQQTPELCVADMRCPESAHYIKGKQESVDLFFFPNIHPILIHCALELNGRFAAAESPLLITTPCATLKDYGNALGLPYTTFLTWNEFAGQYAISLPRLALRQSPIPPGFFLDLECDSLTLASRNQIDHFLNSKHKQMPRLVELLYCENGCHNGDGILEDK